jgi:6,7-dimethyl-8-ribityllumazine synthase
MSVSTVNGNHTILNTMLAAATNSQVNNNGVDITLAAVPGSFSTPANNKLAVDHHDNGCYLQIWRVAQ